MALDLGVTPTGAMEIHVGDQCRRFDNLVLDAGWLSLLSRMDGVDGAMVPTWLHFGTGESDPEPTDSGLEQRVNATAKAETSREYRGLVDAGSLTAYSEVVVRFDYAVGELTGDEWTEVGLSYDQAYTEPYNRALIRDENRVPTPLVVMSDEPVTAYVRLRLYLTGWGQWVYLNTELGVNGVLSMEGNIQSATQGLWQKGFPVVTAEMGGRISQAEGFDVTVPTVKQYFAITPAVSESYSRMLFRARDGVPMLRLDFAPTLVKPAGLTLYLRVRITIVRG